MNVISSIPLYRIRMSSRRVRQYAGLALVILAYIGGIIGWSWAVQSVEAPDAPPADSTAVVRLPPQS